MSGIMNMFVATKTTIATAVDAFFNSVSLLLNTSSTNGAQNNTFLDSSTNNFTITRNGNTTQGTFTPFSQTGWGNYFDGTDDRLTTSSALLAYSTGNASTQTATIEAMVYLNAYNASKAGADENAAIVAKGSTYMSFCINHTGNLILYHYDGSVRTPTSSGTVPLNTWTHVAVTLSGGVATFYINGSSSGTGTWYGLAATSDPVYIGEATGASASAINGYLSNLRISTTARTISVPTAPYTSDASTALLTCQSNRFVDNSSNGYAVTVDSGTPSVQAFSPFLPTAAYDAAVVGGSSYQDASGDYLSFATNNSGFQLGAGDWSVEGWTYLISSSSAYIACGQTDSATIGGSSFYVGYNGDGCSAFSGGSRIDLSLGTVNKYEWTHIVFCRSGSTVSCFKNGVRQATGTFSGTINNGGSGYPPKIGAAGPSTGSEQYLSSVRIVVGSSPYNAASTTITVPTAPVTAITNTTVLTNFTNAGIFDSAAKNDLETVGNAQVSTTQAKWGTTSMAFDGTGDWLLVQNGLNIGFNTGNFTVEGWINLSNVTANQTKAIVSGTGTNTFGLRVGQGYLGNVNGLNISKTGVADLEYCAFTFSINTWYHIAVVRSGTTIYFFVDGVQQTTQGSGGGSFSFGSPTQYYVGCNNDTNEPFAGYIDDLRITKGYARYTANFTPPTAAFPLQ